MIPILYQSNETRFRTNGLGRLADCIRCLVTEERNGVYECEFDYPVTGVMYPELLIGRIVAVTHDNSGDVQPFIIYKRSIPNVQGVVTFNAHHISYRLSDVVVLPYQAHTCAEALDGLVTHATNTNPFKFWTDKTTQVKFDSPIPRLARNVLGGEENSILDVFGGGDYEFDKFEVKLHQNRGQDSGLEIRYGKNLVDLSQDIDATDTYNAIVPFWYQEDSGLVMLPERIISYAAEGEQIDAAPMDLSDAFETAPTETQLRNLAKSRFERSDTAEPSENITVDFVQLAQTKEYSDYAELQEVRLCDSVSVIYLPAGVNKRRQKVVKVVYNVLLERYDSIELGQPTVSLGQQIREALLAEVPTKAAVNNAIQYASDLIRGGLGGYVVLKPNKSGQPEEILIMDTPDVKTAVNVWRWNKGGLAHSSSGYEGPYDDIAITQDGKINASMIKTGSLQVGGVDDQLGTIMIYDEDGNKAGEIDSFGATFWGEYGVEEQAPGEDPKIKMYNTMVVIDRGRFIIRTDDDYQLDLYSTYTYYTGRGWVPELMAYSQGIMALSTSEASIALYPFTNSTYGGATVYVGGGTYIDGKLTVTGTKSRTVDTENYQERLLYAYETPTPLFGDIGEAVIDEDGLCYVDIDDVFGETIESRVEYQVFLQKEGPGDCWISDKTRSYFVIEGTPGLRVAWELKAAQRGYEYLRLERTNEQLETYETVSDDIDTKDYSLEPEEEFTNDYDQAAI